MKSTGELIRYLNACTRLLIHIKYDFNNFMHQKDKQKKYPLGRDKRQDIEEDYIDLRGENLDKLGIQWNRAADG